MAARQINTFPLLVIVRNDDVTFLPVVVLSIASFCEQSAMTGSGKEKF